MALYSRWQIPYSCNGNYDYVSVGFAKTVPFDCGVVIGFLYGVSVFNLLSAYNFNCVIDCRKGICGYFWIAPR